MVIIKRIILSICLLLFVCFYASAQNTSEEFNKNLIKSTHIESFEGHDYYLHNVEAKQTLFSIAKLYNVSIDTICLINNLINRELNAGLVLRIPVEKTLSDSHTVETSTVYNENDNIFTSGYDEFLNNYKSFDKLFDRIEPNVNKTFNVALLIPLYYSNAENLDVSSINGEIISGTNKSFRFIQFYQGAMIAIDSLNNRGMNVKLHVFDVDEKGENIYSIISSNSLSNMDLIIGPFFRKPYNAVCKYAAEHKISIVNPTQNAKNLTCNNLYSYKNNVDVKLKYSYIVNYILDNYQKANIIIYTQDQEKDQETIDYISSLLRKGIPQRIELQNFDIYNFLLKYSAADSTMQEGELYDTITIEDQTFTLQQLQEQSFEYTEFNNEIKIFSQNTDGNDGYTKYLIGARDNVIISLAKDYASVLDNVTRLSRFSKTHQIYIFGDESWTDFELDNKNLNSINYHFCTHKFIDYKNTNVINFINNFSTKYVSEPNPSQYAYLGYDTFLYFLELLFYFDTKFPENISKIHYDGLESSFFFIPAKDAYGFENYFSNIYKIHGYQYEVIHTNDNIWEKEAVDIKSIFHSR